MNENREHNAKVVKEEQKKKHIQEVREGWMREGNQAFMNPEDLQKGKRWLITWNAKENTKMEKKMQRKKEEKSWKKMVAMEEITWWTNERMNVKLGSWCWEMENEIQQK